MRLSVREIERQDIRSIIEYWMNSTDAHLEGMGVDLQKMPSEVQWRARLERQIASPLDQKRSYCMIWLLEGQAVGHCNVNDIVRGDHARMHLHMWQSDMRQQGLGAPFVRMSVPHFFEAFDLKRLFCEPYALNPAPNKTLPKAGFRFVKEYITTPGYLNFEQPVNQWVFEADQLSLS